MILTVTEAAFELTSRLYDEPSDNDDYASFVYGATVIEFEERLQKAVLSGELRPRNGITGMFDDSLAFMGKKAMVSLDDVVALFVSEGMTFPSSEAAFSRAPEKDNHQGRNIETPDERRASHDITTERGCRRLILENWSTVRQLHGPNADARQVWKIIERNKGRFDETPTLKTVQNRLRDLRNEKLIP